MKYVIALILCAVCAAGGYYGAGYKMQADFKAMTNLSWTELVAADAQCEKNAKEPCDIYGGFAPRSAFNGR